MKSVLISIQPKWCELITSGKKTVEVRKTKPKIETPFKCYIYCTKGETIYHPRDIFGNESLNGKVIGEFVCNKIGTTSWINSPDHPLWQDGFCEEICLTNRELYDYSNGDTFYEWYISDLVIYDKPKELSEFGRECDYEKNCGDCPHLYVENTPSCYETWCEVDGFIPLKRPPQSWCYVEERSKQ